MDRCNITPVNHGGVVIFGRPKMGENSIIHGIVLRFSAVTVCNDYTMTNTNINNRQMSRQRISINICTEMKP